MQWSNTERHYGIVSMTFHWLIALCVIGLIILGKYMTLAELDFGRQYQLYQLHKSFGVLVFVLMVLRIFWRIMKGVPSYPAHMPGWEKAGAKVSHVSLYALLFVMPLTGWALVSSAKLKLDTLVFGTIKLPHMPEGLVQAVIPAEGLNEIIPLPLNEAATRYTEFTETNYLEFFTKLMHETLGWILIVLLILHVAAALKHHLIDRDDVLTRILPGRRP